MDAAQLFRKFALLFLGALLLAGAAHAANIVVDKDTITFTVVTGQDTVNVSLDDQSTQALTITNTSGWFSVSANPAGTVPTTLTVTRFGNCIVTAAGCDTTFTVGAGGATKNIRVINSSSGGSGGTSGILTSNLATISMSAVYPNVAVQTVVISSSSASTTTITPVVTQGSNFLTIQSQSAGTIASGSPVTLVLYAYSSAVPNNQVSTGQITVTPGNGTPALTIPVNFTVGSASTTGTLVPSQTPISFNYPSGTLVTLIGVTSSTTTSYTAAASSSGWLRVNFQTSTTSTSNSGSNLYISADTSVVQFMTTGTYQGYVTLTNQSNGADVTTIPVTLYINGGGGGGGTSTGSFAGPSSLTFNYQIGTGAPPYQEILVAGNGTYTITTTGTALSVSASSLTVTGNTGSILVLPAVGGLSAGSYTGTITITSNTGFYQAVNVSVNVSSSPVLYAFVNGATGDYTCSTTVGCNPATVQVRASDNSAQSMTVTASQPWITITNPESTTPGNFTLGVTTTGLSAGMNNATVTVTGGSAGQVTIPVAVQVGTTSGGGSGSGSLTISSSSLTFNSVNAPQTLSISSTTSSTASISAGCSWVTVSPSGSVSLPQSLTVSVNSAVTSGSTCTISLTGNNSTTQTVMVTYNPSGSGGSSGSINVDKTSLSFATTTGTSPASQAITVTGANGSSGVGFSASTDVSWMSVSPTSGTTTGTVTVTVNATGLSTGAFAGNVIISATNSYRIPVTLIISAPTSVAATPTSLSFTYVAGSANPSAKQIQVTGTGSSLSYSATVQTGASWLSVTPASGTAPATLDVKVDPSSLNPGSYSGSIVVAGVGGATGSTTINVDLTVTAPLPTITRVTNGASFNTGSLSAGEIITLFGTGMGPSTLQGASTTNGQYPTTVGGVTVTIGGYPAPLIYVRNDQIAAIVPYEVNRPFLANLTVLVRYLGQSSNGVTLPQVGAAPGIFTVGSGTGQGAILNSNLSQNSASNPATKGDVIVLYVTGEGVTSPAGTSGALTPVNPPYRQPVSGNVTVTIDGIPATVQFYAEAPLLVAGVMQVNVVVPAGASSGAVPVVVRVGDAPSQLTANNIGAVTVAVR
jgi:uncharacterized protein (TIGR03437 family)